jgi:cytochrome oxidase Cu insertion factor (SCO1/SenC/PrrC family)
LLRVGFGLLWILDGFLQAQPKMAVGLPSQVIQPVAANSPAWVQHLVNWGGTVWSYHPIQAGAASVWIQVGIGAWLLVAVRGPWSRLAGVASVGWGLVVWVFGESFGGIFAPGLTFLFGAPGAVLLYAVAGALIALPEGAWRGTRLGRLLLGGIGLFFIGMAVLQAWPGRGFWQGGKSGTLAGMIQSMSGTSQPHYLYLIVSGAGSFTSAHALIGAAPMAAATANRTADPILAEAIAGSTPTLDIPAPGFQLTDQNGRTVTQASLRGKVVLMTFLDPVCTTDCPIIGLEFRQAGVLLGSANKNVELVAVVANPTYRSTAATQAFDTEEGLNTLPNWLFLTGSLSQLQQIWGKYGIVVQNLPAGAMSAHTDLAVVIDRNGIVRQQFSDDPGPGTTSTKSSFAALLAGYARQALAGS